MSRFRRTTVVTESFLGVAMRPEQHVRCPRCYQRMEPHELRTIYYKMTYHQHCFLLLLREKARQDKESHGVTGHHKA